VYNRVSETCKYLKLGRIGFPVVKSTVTMDLTKQTGSVSTGDVDVSSIITQVARTPSPVKTSSKARPDTRSEAQSVRINASNPVATAAVKKSFFQKLLCCGAKDGTIAQQQGAVVGSPTTSSSKAKNTEQQLTPQLKKPSQRTDPANEHNSPNAAFGRPIRQQPSPARMPDMGPASLSNKGKMCLALDLDETLVHSSFQYVDNASFVIDVTIEGTVHNVYVMKRPGVDEFMRRMAEHFEIIIYTASLSKYADPLLDILDPHKVIAKRLFRENCVFYDGHYVKDLSLLDREIGQTIIVDNSPMSYMFHPENAIDCGSFFDDPMDVEMWQIADFLESIAEAEDVRHHCRHWREWCETNPTSVPTQMTQY
jgi:RNA polymerase II subunit A small phosphatase-like protein